MCVTKVVDDAVVIHELVDALNDLPLAEDSTRKAITLTIRQMAAALARKYTRVIRVEEKTEGDGYSGGPY